MSDVDAAIAALEQSVISIREAAEAFESRGLFDGALELRKVEGNINLALVCFRPRRALLTPTISEKDVEAGAKALWERRHPNVDWLQARAWRSDFIDDSRSVLEAVAAARQRHGSGVE